MKTNELTGAALDWAVAKCLGTEHLFAGHEVGRLHYSTDWSQAGPIIDREGVTLVHMGDDWRDSWRARMGNGHWQGHEIHGPTPLISAMRCYVASRLGDEVEIPDELV